MGIYSHWPRVRTGDARRARPVTSVTFSDVTCSSAWAFPGSPSRSRR